MTYDSMVKEAARETEQKRELSDEETRVLNQKMQFLAQSISDGYRPAVSIEYFVPDVFKSGGRYEKTSGIVKKIDSVYRRVILFGENGVSDGKSIKFNDIIGICGAFVNHLDDLTNLGKA